MNKFKKKLLFVFLAAFVVITMLVYFFYLRHVSVYEPVAVRFPDISLKESYHVKVFSITPLNRRLPFPFFSERISWECTYGFHKSIELELPDTLSNRIRTVEIVINKDNISQTLSRLDTAGTFNGVTTYILPKTAYKKVSILKVLWSLTHWKEFKTGIIIVIAGLLLIIFLSGRKKLLGLFKKNNKPAVKAKFLWKQFIKTPGWFHLHINRVFHKLKEIKFTKKQIFSWLKTIIVSVLIAFSLFYGYLFFRFNLATLITSVLFILMCGLFLWFLIWVIGHAFKTSGTVKEKWYFALSIFIILWLAFELFLRLAGINKSYSEKVGLYYSSGFIEHDINDKDHQGLMVHPPYHSYIDKRKEFAYEMKCNAEGLRDMDRAVKKDTNEYRIICLGNSFTEGIGTPQDSTWPKLLENSLNTFADKKVSVFNAGKSGSDPFFHYALLEKRLLKYQPDLVLLALGSSDFEFYRFRGGVRTFYPPWGSLPRGTFMGTFLCPELYFPFVCQ